MQPTGTVAGPRARKDFVRTSSAWTCRLKARTAESVCSRRTRGVQMRTAVSADPPGSGPTAFPGVFPPCRYRAEAPRRAPARAMRTHHVGCARSRRSAQLPHKGKLPLGIDTCRSPGWMRPNRHPSMRPAWTPDRHATDEAGSSDLRPLVAGVIPTACPAGSDNGSHCEAYRQTSCAPDSGQHRCDATHPNPDKWSDVP